jgi:hypothetical protein
VRATRRPNSLPGSVQRDRFAQLCRNFSALAATSLFERRRRCCSARCFARHAAICSGNRRSPRLSSRCPTSRRRPFNGQPNRNPFPTPPRVVYLETERGTPPALIMACLAVGGLVFVGLVFMMINGSKRPPESSKTARPPAVPSFVPVDAPPPASWPELRPNPPQVSPNTAALAAKQVSPDREGQTWSLNDFHDYLARRNVECKATERMQASFPGMWLTTKGGERLLVQHFDVGPSAKIAGVAQMLPNQKLFHWGRFLIVAPDGPFFRAVREAFS